MNYKIDVSASTLLNEAVQKKAFELGYIWASGGKQVTAINAKFLFIKNGEITWSCIQGTFNSEDLQEIAAVDFLKLDTELIMVGEYPVTFKDNGDIKVGCQRVPLKLLKKIYKRAKEMSK